MSVLVTTDWSPKGFDKLPNGWAAQLSWHVSGVDNERQAVDAVPIRQGNSHPLATRLVCQSVGIAEAKGPSYFRVEARFDQRPFPFGNASNDPLEAEATYSWHFGGETSSVEHDVEGNALFNSAFEPSSNPPQKFTGIVELSVTRNEPAYDLAFFLGFQNRINSVDWIIEGVRIPKYLALCIGIAPTTRYTRSRGYSTVGYRFIIRPAVTEMEVKGLSSPHDHSFLDVGYQAFYDDDGTPKPGLIRTRGSNERPPKPVRLNGQGKIVKGEQYTADGNDSISTTSPKGALVEKRGDSYYLRYKKYLTADFNKLGL